MISWAPVYNVKKKVTIGRMTLKFEARSTESAWGRFGGGWDWKLGFQASTPSAYGWTVIISLLIAEATVSWRGAKAKAEGRV